MIYINLLRVGIRDLERFCRQGFWGEFRVKTGLLDEARLRLALRDPKRATVGAMTLADLPYGPCAFSTDIADQVDSDVGKVLVDLGLVIVDDLTQPVAKTGLGLGWPGPAAQEDRIALRAFQPVAEGQHQPAGPDRRKGQNGIADGDATA